MPEGVALPTISVVVVNYRGTEDVVTCLTVSRDELHYPAEKYLAAGGPAAVARRATGRLRRVAAGHQRGRNYAG